VSPTRARSHPRVSILLPCRNAADTLDETLRSLCNQTLGDLEILAVDDGSTDGTGRLLDRWRASDSRLRVLYTPARGLVSALNTAASAARGTILARMDADDVARPERLERQVELLMARPDLAACGTQVRYFPRHQVRDGARRYERWINAVIEPEDMDRNVFVECPIPHPTLAIWRAVFERAGGYRDTDWPEDYDLLLRLWSAGLRLGKVPAVLLDWRDGPGRLSRTHERYSPKAFRDCKAHFLGERVADRRLVIWGAGPVGKAFGRSWHAAGGQIVAFVDLDPRKIGQCIHGAPVIAPAAIGRFRDTFVVAAVGQPDAREEIRTALRSLGFVEPGQFRAVA
jgi:glycosyltransferase involved in cell wall biosynthesis